MFNCEIAKDNAAREKQESILKLFNVRITYPNGFTVFQNINIEIQNRQFVAIVGRSGSGKTTLLRSIGNLIPLSSGQVVLNGTAGINRSKEGKLSYVFQNPVLLPWRTVLKNVMLPGELVGSNKNTDKAKAMIELVGLTEFINSYPDQLSGGMKARVAIARALTYKPSLLLMDEPFGNLDEITRNKMNMELLRIWEATEVTIIMITHSLLEALFLADRIIVLGPPPVGIVADIANYDFKRPRKLDILETREFLLRVSKLRKLLESERNGNGN